MHTLPHGYIYSLTHTYIHMHTYTYTHMHKSLTYPYTHIYKLTHIYIFTYIYINSYINTPVTHTHIHIYTQIHIYMYSHLHRHTHTLSHPDTCNSTDIPSYHCQEGLQFYLQGLQTAFQLRQLVSGCCGCSRIIRNLLLQRCALKGRFPQG